MADQGEPDLERVLSIIKQSRPPDINDLDDLFNAMHEGTLGWDRIPLERLRMVEEYLCDAGELTETTKLWKIRAHLKERREILEKKERREILEEKETEIEKYKVEKETEIEKYKVDKEIEIKKYKVEKENFSRSEAKFLRREIAAIKAGDSKAVSYADYFAEKNRDGRVHDDGSWVPMAGDTFQEWNNCNPSRGGEEVAVKPWWQEKLGENLIDGVANSYQLGWLGSKQPDVQFFPASVSEPQAHDFIAVGECKGSNWTPAAAGPRGQVMLYLKRILDAQPMRNTAFGFITNNDVVLIVCAIRQAQKDAFMIEWNFSSPLSFGHGMSAFLECVKGDKDNFKPAPCFSGHTAYIEHPLRPGGTCRAFKAKLNNEMVVLKLYGDKEAAAVNCSCLKTLEQLEGVDGACVPTLVGQADCWLAIRPIGRRINVGDLRLNTLIKLVDLLEQVHNMGIVHWDVRFANILIAEDSGNVLLNDWGSSGEMGGEEVLRCGCPEPWCHPELDDQSTGIRDPKHDLYSLVTSAAENLMPGILLEGRKHYFAECLAAADARNYEKLKESLENMNIRD